MAMNFGNIYTLAATWAGSETETQKARDAVWMAGRELTYGIQLPLLKPFWRKREDVITPVAGTQSYNFPTAQGTFESAHLVWYQVNGIRFTIEIVDDKDWHQFARDETSNSGLGISHICNIHQSSGTLQIRFWPIPNGAFIAQIDGGTLRLDFFILDSLFDSRITTTGSDASFPLMPDSRRPGIIWKAVEILAAAQGDTNLINYGAAQGKRFYEAILADDIGRTGTKQRILGPTEPVGDYGGGSFGGGRDHGGDYGHHHGRHTL